MLVITNENNKQVGKNNKFISIEKYKRVIRDSANLAGFFLEVIEELAKINKENNDYIEKRFEDNPMPDDYEKFQDYIKQVEMIGNDL